MKFSPMAKPSKELDWIVISARLTTYVILALILSGPITEVGKGLQALAQILARAEGWVCW
jgi:hypothetical protein